jgi:hypothetical protein
MNTETTNLVAAAVAEERERLAELMERQHTWISSVSAARLIRGNSKVLMHGYVDPFHVEPVAWRVKVGEFWIHGGTREGLARAVSEQLAVPIQDLKPQPLYSHPADRLT